MASLSSLPNELRISIFLWLFRNSSSAIAEKATKIDIRFPRARIRQDVAPTLLVSHSLRACAIEAIKQHCVEVERQIRDVEGDVARLYDKMALSACEGPSAGRDYSRAMGMALWYRALYHSVLEGFRCSGE
ncbi:MAG: hypothetical protein M1831_001973 [Alyxoria varia]|nr:MAG: hypothetical protein M1831_001973 [Alyxoria varia]